MKDLVKEGYVTWSLIQIVSNNVHFGLHLVHFLFNSGKIIIYKIYSGKNYFWKNSDFKVNLSLIPLPSNSSGVNIYKPKIVTILKSKLCKFVHILRIKL